MKRKKLSDKQVKRILRQAGAAHRHQAAVSEPKPAVEAEMEVDLLPPGLYLVDGHGNMRLVGTPAEVLPMAMLPPPLPAEAEAAEVAAPPLPEPMDCYPIPKELQLVRGGKPLADASAAELLDELEVKLPGFLIAYPDLASGATRFRSHGRQSEAIGLYQLLTMWMQRQMYS